MESRVVDRTGLRYGRLLVLYQVGTDPHRKALWLCACDCGAHKVVSAGNLQNGSTQSCGCLRAEKSRERAIAGQRFVQPRKRSVTV